MVPDDSVWLGSTHPKPLTDHVPRLAGTVLTGTRDPAEIVLQA